MGLDVSFNRQQAIDAGLELFVDYNGTEEEIAAVKADVQDSMDEAYLEYLQREQEFIRIPSTGLIAANDGVQTIVVRANKWGLLYEPLTKWLKANNIDWSEF